MYQRELGDLATYTSLQDLRKSASGTKVSCVQGLIDGTLMLMSCW